MEPNQPDEGKARCDDDATQALQQELGSREQQLEELQEQNQRLGARLEVALQQVKGGGAAGAAAGPEVSKLQQQVRANNGSLKLLLECAPCIVDGSRKDAFIAAVTDSLPGHPGVGPRQGEDGAQDHPGDQGAAPG